jgi:segregation and condensation protein A
MQYIVKTPEFEGPFDLLLHLISRQKVDLWQVSIARITEEYLREVKRMQSLNLEVATEFLVVAATLIELKAIKLLPGAGGDDDAIDALLEERDLLFARLLQYQAYKQVAGLLSERFKAAAKYVGRTVGPDEQLEVAVPNLLDKVTPVDIAMLAAKAFTPARAPMAGEHIAPPPRLSLAETVVELRDLLEQLRRTSFKELVGAGPLPVEVVVRFLAVLELYKQSLIELEQGGSYQDISIAWLGENGAGPGEEDSGGGGGGDDDDDGGGGDQSVDAGDERKAAKAGASGDVARDAKDRDGLGKDDPGEVGA